MKRLYSIFVYFFLLNIPLFLEAKCLRLVSLLSTSLPLVSGGQATGMEKTKLQVSCSSRVDLRWPEVTDLNRTSDTA